MGLECALRVNACEVSVYAVRTFMKCTYVCAAHLYMYQIVKKPSFPSLTDEIAEPRPDMNIKVAAFTVSEKSIITHLDLVARTRDIVAREQQMR